MRLFGSTDCCEVQACTTLLLCNQVVHLRIETYHCSPLRRYCASLKKSVEGVSSLKIKHGRYPIPREAKVMNPKFGCRPVPSGPPDSYWLQCETLERRVFQPGQIFSLRKWILL